jgi:hypothetical protein
MDESKHRVHGALDDLKETLAGLLNALVDLMSDTARPLRAEALPLR